MGCILLLFVVIRWEEERYTDGSKWRFLEHKGPVFAPPYEPLPDKVKFYYDGEFFCVKDKLQSCKFFFFLVKSAVGYFCISRQAYETQRYC